MHIQITKRPFSLASPICFVESPHPAASTFKSYLVYVSPLSQFVLQHHKRKNVRVPENNVTKAGGHGGKTPLIFNLGIIE
jgi:hypothetical protein